MHPNGGLRVAAKRTALADFSNISRHAPADTGKGLGKQKSVATFTVLQGKENQDSRDIDKDQSAKSAQRQPPKSASSVNLQQHDRQSGRALLRTSEPQQLIAKDLPTNFEVKEQVELPNIVEALSSAGATLPELGSLDQSSTYPKFEDDYQMLLANVPAPSTKQHGDYNSYFSGSSGSTIPEPIMSSNYNLHEEEHVESLYVDAVEEMPRAPASQVEDGAAVHVHIANAMAATSNHAITSNTQQYAQPEVYLPHTLPDDGLELSDYDDEAYGDDQGYMTAHSYRSNGENTTTAFSVMFPPKIGRRGQAELEAAKLYVDAHRTKEEEDEECWDVSMVAEYGDDIFEYCRELEVRCIPFTDA